jgi:hypothetical protein
LQPLSNEEVIEFVECLEDLVFEKKKEKLFSIFIWRLEIKIFIFALAFRLKKLSLENISIERYRTEYVL